MDTIQRACFWLGEKFFRLGLFLQDQVENYVAGTQAPTPQQILDTLLLRNQRCLLSRPLRTHKPVGLVITCIDHRIDWDIVSGDVRDCFDIVRLPGAVMPDVVLETIRMAIKEHRVKLVLLVEHTNCAMHGIANMGDDAPDYYNTLVAEMNRKEQQVQRLLEDEYIQGKISDDELIITRATLNTTSRELQVKEIIERSNLASRDPGSGIVVNG